MGLGTDHRRANNGLMARADATKDPYIAAREVCRRHAKSFYFASPFLPLAKRRHAYAVYALCRRLDDAVDNAPDEAAALASMERFGDTLDQIYDTEPLGDPVLEAARLTVAACDIPRGRWVELCMGVEADLHIRRFADWPSLERYCYLVAGVVGLMMCSVFDMRDLSARPKAIAMGNAMQLTNILRDVREDLLMNRIYLPAADMERFGVSERDLKSMANGNTITPGFRQLMRFEVRRARDLYQSGFEGLQALERDGSRQAAAAMGVIYGGILDVIEKADYDVFSARRRLNWWQKIRRVPRALKLARQSAVSASVSSSA